MCLFPCILPSNEDSWKYLACLIGDKYYIVAFKMFLSLIADRDKRFYLRLLIEINAYYLFEFCGPFEIQMIFISLCIYIRYLYLAADCGDTNLLPLRIC